MSAELREQALRKRMLILRAAIERAELAGDVEQLREAVSLPRMIGASLSKVGVVGAATTAFGLLRKYPVLASALSLTFRQLGGLTSRLSSRAHQPRRGSLLRSVLSVVGTVGGVSVVGWLAWRWWQRQRPPRNAEFR